MAVVVNPGLDRSGMKFVLTIRMKMDLDHNTTSSHNETPWFYECSLNLDQDSRRIALFLLYLFLFMVGLVENCLVIWVNWHRRHSASGVLFCVLNISLSDLMVVFTMPFFMLEVAMDDVWVWGQFLCKVTHFIYVINFYSSSFFLAFMTLERYLTIARPTTTSCFPLQPRHRRWLLCAGVWLLSLVLALLENVHVDLLEWDEPGCFLMPEKNFTEWYLSLTIFSLIFQLLGPASVIITCNLLIARAIRASPDIQNHRDIWLLHVYSLVFVACWLPYHFVMFLLMVDVLDPFLMSCNTTIVLFFSYSLKMHIDHNTSDTDEAPWFYECSLNLDQDSRRIALFLLYLFLFMVGLVENCLVIWVNWRRRHSASGVLFCVLNISLSDLMVVFTMPFFMLEVAMNKVWVWGQFLCKVTHFIYIINFYSSSFFLAFMTLERYLTVARPTTTSCFPLQPRHRRWLLCAGLWLLSLVLGLLENVHVDLLEWDEPGCYMIPEMHFVEWFVSVSFFCLIFQFLGPASVIITCNILIARSVRATPDVENRRDLWLLHVYSLVFVVCWLPYHFGISLFHCIANPILYNFLSKNFRANLINDILSRISSTPANTPANAADDNERDKNLGT
ncbi:hypothetical protein QTP70_005540 [Hemibagrus guttatus]|uniref:G-protein coupled receptors family 1 profile domain-containing protein n=1 Tax=Hemibagrus guttatus TaxID=175788 RepID=A0AAE0UUT8_9TELE|nr:hypothetical protein QTP70_005540 [Hemibagrus guttatus]